MMGKLEKQVKDYKCKDIEYIYHEDFNNFQTLYDRDLQLFIIWPKARFKEKEIIKELNNSFNILGCMELLWTKENIDDNFHRIYDVAPTGGVAGKRSEVGDGASIVVVLEDLIPNYQYRFDASLRCKIVNSNIVDKKIQFRQLLGGGHTVHSTDNLNEFFNNSILLFGRGKTFDLLERNKWDGNIENYPSDLIGANGWASVDELFDVLNLTTQYVVLRSSETIVATVEDLSGDVDILCSNIGEFAAVANARNIWNSKNFFHVKIKGKDVLFDIRYVGDEYFDKDWQNNIIKNRVLTENNIYIPRADDHFFTHLYHACIHKPFIYEKYVAKLEKLAKSIGIERLNDSCQNDKNYIIRLLKGYLLANKYKLSIPNDDNVYINIAFMSKLKKISKTKLFIRLRFAKLKNMPAKTMSALKVKIKRNKPLFNLLFSLRAYLHKFSKNKNL